MVASGQFKAPIAIGRDHLDAGSVASPYRETEGMIDGSDPIADWPILNALLNTSAGAHWVSVHHGGGVGIGYSIDAGMVVVADGSELAAQKLERVLTTDPGTGVMRHADAGYDRALAVAARRGVRIPMRDREAPVVSFARRPGRDHMPDRGRPGRPRPPEDGLPFVRHDRAAELRLDPVPVTIANGRIDAFEDGDAELRVDASGCAVMPGFLLTVTRTFRSSAGGPASMS